MLGCDENSTARFVSQIVEEDEQVHVTGKVVMITKHDKYYLQCTTLYPQAETKSIKGAFLMAV